MPEIQLSTTTSSMGIRLPPAAAFEAPLRILKRPSSTSQSPSPSTTQTQKTFKEREAQYQAARERIFGEDTSEKDPDRSGNAGGKSKLMNSAARSIIIRDPLGPTSGTEDDANSGFHTRRKKGGRVVTQVSTQEENEDTKEDLHSVEI
ncbi:hypothetical protein K439DRAFT_1632459 [Ramaria rubella]|nr:hypothetical protein K439DRAFT_1632459 [Ramaria rubella]